MSTQNVDPIEIEKFSQIAHKWWDKESEFKTLHQINPLRLGYIQKFVDIQGKNILDMGCGGGILSEALAETGATVTGIDLAKKSIKIAQLHALENNLNIDYKHISAEEMAIQKPESFDVITCMEMLEHVPNPESIVRACYQLLKPNGWVFFSTINRNLKSYALMVVAAEYVLNMVQRGTHDYAKFIKPSELARMARHVGLTQIDGYGLVYKPLSKSFELSPDMDVNYFLAMQKI
ncbi:bifunctional 2-polyprenyl-6-hydroxyphenol methylase/3-demethylubiquinol 3-O-methyltransferase UbiG [Neisseria sp. Ec49-e6-T10]|uniref:bifunctional 2-polyprenyl-6-hydroxyphenol methylase/3-demethylubiquinol 3-O-methyltransferase UbiG n=1 Tax=Neisseria sp. Ec49-e6-T10 TaxID=3140744 RepID=UPI003EBC0D3D